MKLIEGQEVMEAAVSNNEWVSVSELAKHLNVSHQTIYNRIRKGVYETKTFSRGVYKGFLIKYNIDNGN